MPFINKQDAVDVPQKPIEALRKVLKERPTEAEIEASKKAS